MFDLIQSLQDKGIDVRQHSTNEDEYRICCLFCVDRGESPDEKFRLGFNVRTGVGGCFNCGWKSRNALLMILRRIGVEGGFDPTFVLHVREKPSPVSDVKLPDGFQPLSELDDDDVLFFLAIAYAKKRGITPRQFIEKEVGATVQDGKYRYRLIFPVRDGSAKLVGFVGRDWTGKHPAKYMNSMDEKHIYNARPDKYDREFIILSEGLTKSLAIERATGYDICSAATLGNAMTDLQFQQLKDFDEVILFPDPDKPGLNGYMANAAHIASSGRKVSLAWPWPSRQADDLPSKDIRGALIHRKPYTMTLEWELRVQAADR